MATTNFVTLTTVIEADWLNDVDAAVYETLPAKADLASPTFTGTPTLPTGTIATTQAAGNDTTKVATTAYALAAAVAINTSTATVSNKTLDESNRYVGCPINAQSGTTYTFVIADAGKFCTFSNGAATTVTVPPNADVAFPVGTEITCVQTGAGKVTLAAGAGVTVSSQSSYLACAAQYVGVMLKKTATNTWLLLGNLIA